MFRLVFEHHQLRDAVPYYNVVVETYAPRMCKTNPMGTLLKRFVQT